MYKKLIIRYGFIVGLILAVWFLFLSPKLDSYINTVKTLEQDIVKLKYSKNVLNVEKDSILLIVDFLEHQRHLDSIKIVNKKNDLKNIISKYDKKFKEIISLSDSSTYNYFEYWTDSIWRQYSTCKY